MDPTCHLLTVQAGGGGLMVWGMFSWDTSDLLILINICLNATDYSNIVAEHVHPFIATIIHILTAISSMIMNHVTNQKSLNLL